MKKWLNRKRMHEHRRGQGMVEFALAIPIFLMLVLGIIEFGRMFLMYTSVFAGAREGARYGAAVETVCDTSGLHDAVRRVGFFAGDVNIGIQYDDGFGNLKACNETVLGDRVNVTTEITFDSITGVIPELTLRSTARRTLIKRAFLEWTLQPPSDMAGNVPPAVTFGPKESDTVTPEASDTVTPEPSDTVTPEPSDTTTTTPVPETCVGEWQMHYDLSQDKTEYFLYFTNNTEKIHQLTKVSISWNTGGGIRTLQSIDYSNPPDDYLPIWSGADNQSPFTYFLPDPLEINPGEDYIIHFVLTRSDKVTGIQLDFNVGVSECILAYP